ncbi:MAG: leucine-rich repeat protein, partial [Paramuribaculum sp.]|nr:leucine-rich repeat protein [Paramuribaculum sp.]
CTSFTPTTNPAAVSSLDPSAFEGCTSLTSIEVDPENQMFSSYSGVLFNKNQTELLCFPEGEKGCYDIPNFVTGIGELAFSGCVNLLEITIPNSITSIGKEAFSNCPNLTSIKVCWEYPIYLEENCFSNETYMAAVLSIPELSIMNYLDSNWWTLFDKHKAGEFNVKENYSDDIFNYHLIENPENRQAILVKGDYSGMTEVNIPERITDLSDESNPVRYYITQISPYAFMDCVQLKSVKFNSRSKLTEIRTSTFRGCTNLTSIDFPALITSIGGYAFYGCNSLPSVTIPNSVTTIGNSAFAGCRALGWSITLPESVTTLGDGAFASCLQLRYVTLNEGLKQIGVAAFNSCDQLYSITIPGSVQTIESKAFYGCSNLTNVFLNEGIEKIGDEVFSNCKNLKSIKIPGSVQTIGERAFFLCIRLNKVIINDGLKTIGQEAFYLCSNLTTIEIPGSVTYIKTRAFADCSSLTSLKIGDGKYGFSRGVDLFSGVNSLRSLYIGVPFSYGVIPQTQLGNLTTLTFGNLVTEIDDGIGRNLTKLEHLTLGNSLTDIPKNSFTGCTGLKEIVIPPSVETIGASAFAGNSNLSKIIMGHNIKSIGENAFEGCPAEIVQITAPNPPMAPNNTFSSYNGKLYLQGENAIDAYYDAYTCWDRFDSYTMIEPEEVKIEGGNVLNADPGEVIQLTATIYPENVTLPHIFWRSTNPSIASVDINGLVSVHSSGSGITAYAAGEDNNGGGCQIIAESLYANAPIAMVAINSELADIEDIVIDRPQSQTIDYTEPYDVYSMQGVWLGRSVDAVAPGFYILRQGSKAAKILK